MHQSQAQTHPAEPLRALVRGLALLFWSLPLELVIGINLAAAGWFGNFGIMAPVLPPAMMFIGLGELKKYKPEHCTWQRLLDQARLMAMINTGLAPFLYWWRHIPANPFFESMLVLLAVCAFLLLARLNRVVVHLAGVVPAATLDTEIRKLGGLNHTALVTVAAVIAIHGLAALLNILPRAYYDHILDPTRPRVLVLFVLLVLVPVALTMGMIWRSRETVLDTVFRGAVGAAPEQPPHPHAHPQ